MDEEQVFEDVEEAPVPLSAKPWYRRRARRFFLIPGHEVLGDRESLRVRKVKKVGDRRGTLDRCGKTHGGVCRFKLEHVEENRLRRRQLHQLVQAGKFDFLLLCD